MNTAARILLPLALSASSVLALTSETWTGLPANPSVITVQKDGIAKRSPNSTATLTTSTLSNLAAGTGVRLRGTVTPTVSGNYTFAVSGSNNVTLWLSTDSSRFGKRPVAWQHEPSSVQQWNKFAAQQSAPITLTAGTAYYIEAIVMSDKAAGHLALGWKTPGSTVIAAIPAANLAPLQPDPADANNNNLPDAWEAQTGLAASTIPGALSEYADPDNDGITNFHEYLLASEPLAKNTISNGLTRDTWQEIQGQQVPSLTAARTRFLSHPNSSSHVPGIDLNMPGIGSKNYGARYRGFLVAPATGTYRLWIAGDDDAELWFADGTVNDPATGASLTSRFGKQLLAHTRNPGGLYSTAYRDFDLIPSQRSRAVQLTAGEAYYIEVLHKNESIASSHISLAWETPGQPRAIVPASAFRSDVPEDSDRDNDSLPDAWEISKALSITDNGFTDAKQGQYGDHDADGLNNLLEFQLGTNPKAADTDGDGLSDSAEVNYYRTNPLVSNAIPTTLHTTANLHNPMDTSFPWEKNFDGTITAHERRGWIDFPVIVAPGQQGIYEIRLVASISPSALTIPLSFHIDGQKIAHASHALKTTPNTTAPIKALTPFLPVGAHILRVFNHNPRADFRLKIHSLTLHRLGGADADSNGIADWAEEKFAAGNRITTLSTESLTSPAYIEGVTTLPAALRLTRSAGVPPTPISPQYGCNGIFFAHIPLDPAAPTHLKVSFQSGEAPETHTLAWAATNILAHSALTIAKGDSLRLTAHGGEAPEGSFTLTGSAGVPPTPSSPSPADQPLVLTFDQPGTHTLTATWTPPTGDPITSSLTLTVRSADFGAPFQIQTYNRRTWEISGINGMGIEADAALFWNETTAPGATSRRFLANAYEAGDYRTIARCPDTGRILAAGTVSAFSLSRATQTNDAQVVEIRPDGSKVIRFTVVAENLPANAEIRLRMNYQGTTFMDGSRDLILRPGDFDESGIANIRVETSSDPPQLCHSMSAILID
jgi:PA14 domain/Bacterial TSP3 repeat